MPYTGSNPFPSTILCISPRTGAVMAGAVPTDKLALGERVQMTVQQSITDTVINEAVESDVRR